jgi:hypothetical protein
MDTVLELKPIPQGAAPATPAPAPTVDVIVARAIAGGASVAKLTGLYLKLRDAGKDLTLQAKTRMAPIQAGMAAIEAYFLDQMNKLQVDSLKNEAGTPYRTEHVAVTVADVSVFLDYVLTRALAGLPLAESAREAIKKAMVDSGQLTLIEARASKSAVEALLQETKELPPGLNRRSELVVNVRAA